VLPTCRDSPRTASSASAEVRPSLVGPAFRGDWRLCSDLPRAPVAAMGRLEDEILEPWEMCLFHSLKKKLGEKSENSDIISRFIHRSGQNFGTQNP
jgi:hypothetical protein